MIGPAMTHAPCNLSLQRRILEARREALIPPRRWFRRGRPQPPNSADVARAALRGSEDVWASLRG